MKSQFIKLLEKTVPELADRKLYVDTRVSGGRIKVAYMNPFPKEIEEKILKLPYVTKVGFAGNRELRGFYAPIWGATIHLSERVSEMTFDKEVEIEEKVEQFKKEQIKKEIFLQNIQYSLEDALRGIKQLLEEV
jgi:hypothetical protein